MSDLLGDVRSLTSRDEAILNALARHRFLSAKQLHELIQPEGSYKKLTYRLQKLYHHRFVDRPRSQLSLWKGGGRKAFVYGLGDQGAKHLAPTLAEIGQYIHQGASYWTKQNREAKEPYLAHTLMVNAFLVALTVATRRTGTELDWFSEGEWPPDGKRIYARVKGPRGGAVSIPIRPDAYFTLTFKSSRGRTTRHFFLEADQATMPGKRKSYVGTSVYKKFRGYWTWHTKHRAQVKNYGLPGFIVLTTTTTLERAENLREHAREADDKKTGSHMFWFTAESEYAEDPKELLKKIWLSAGDELDSSRTHQLTESSHSTR